MNRKDLEWEWFAFSGLLGGLIGLEEYAVRTKKIKPLSHFVWWLHRDRREVNRYVLAGAWAGFCVWTFQHFFLSSETE